MSETGEIAVALGVLGPLTGLAWWLLLRGFLRRSRLRAEGVSTRGRVTAIRASSSAPGYRTTVIHYAFEAPDPRGAEKTWQRREQLAVGVLHRPAVGDDVPVVYLPSDPAISVVAGNPGGHAMWVMVVAILTGLTGMVLAQLF